MIDPGRVLAMYLDSLADAELSGGVRVVDGIVATSIFDPGRLEAHRAEVRAALLELPEPFLRSRGGGWSFLNACMTRDGEQWTGLHQRMGQLFDMGVALGLVESQMPRELWPLLPGGMPYYVVNDEEPS